MKLLKIIKIYLNKFKYFIRLNKNRLKGNKLSNKSKIGRNVLLANVFFGNLSGCGENSIVINTKVGNYCNISWNVMIGLRNHISSNFTTHDFLYSKGEQIFTSGWSEGKYTNVIGHDVWIGANTIILPGVEIGTGAIVGAGSCVTKSIPPYAVVGGNPVRFIKWRFPKEIISLLLNSNWYEYDEKYLINKREELENLVGFNILMEKEKYNEKKKYIWIK